MSVIMGSVVLNLTLVTAFKTAVTNMSNVCHTIFQETKDVKGITYIPFGKVFYMIPYSEAFLLSELPSRRNSNCCQIAAQMKPSTPCFRSPGMSRELHTSLLGKCFYFTNKTSGSITSDKMCVGYRKYDV